MLLRAARAEKLGAEANMVIPADASILYNAKNRRPPPKQAQLIRLILVLVIVLVLHFHLLRHWALVDIAIIKLRVALILLLYAVFIVVMEGSPSETPCPRGV